MTGGVSWSWKLEVELNSVWTDITEDVMWHKTPVTASRGINGHSITDRVASPGSLTAALDNGESNSAGLPGYYSIYHTNTLGYFATTNNIRLSLTYDGQTRYIWKGYITDVVPTPGQFRERESYISATDYMQRLAEYKLKLLPVQENQRSDQLMQTVLDNVPVAPASTSIETDKFSLPIALASEQDEKTSVLSAIQKICQTVLGYCYIRGNDTNGETLVFQREETRATQTAAATLDNTMSTLRTSRPTEARKIPIVGLIHPVKIDPDATTLLFALDNEIQLSGGDGQTVSLKFRDPANLAQRISAKDVVTTLVANQHYRMSAYSGNVLGDLNAYLTITPTVGANAVEVALYNSGGTRGYINMINIFGRGIYYYNPVEISEGTGDNPENYDFYYLSDPYRARGFLKILYYRSETKYTQVDAVSFLADMNEEFMGYAMNVDIGDRVMLFEYMSGLLGEYTINRVTYTIQTNGTLKVEWELEMADTRDYFVLNSSTLDRFDLLSPY